jgi:MFS superfamily sulfate permease-like transporter
MNENGNSPLKFIPSIDWLRRYPKAWLRLDGIAGLTAAAVVIPKAMAYATIAGLPVQVGLYTHVFRAISEEHPDDEIWPGLLILRIEGRAFFANAQSIADLMWPLIERAKPSVLLLDCDALIDIEYTALKMLTEAEENRRRQGVLLWLAALNSGALKVVQRSKLGKTLGRDRMFFNLEAAVERYEQLGASNRSDEPKPPAESSPGVGGSE